MSDNTIFNKQTNQPADIQPVQNQPTPITTQDLYGPSNVTPAPEINPALSLNAPLVDNIQPPQATSESIQPEQVISEQVNVENAPENIEYQPTIMPQSKFSALLMNKKKLLIAGIGLFLMLIIFIGIFSRLGGGSSGGGVSNATLIYWGLWEENKTMDVIIQDFEKKNPGIKIKYEKQDPEKYKERLVTRIENNSQAPDIFTFHNSWLPSLTSSADNIILPLAKDTITVDEFQKIYYPVIQKDLSKKGAIYGLPQGIDTLSLFINTEIFQAAGVKAPATWEEFNSTAKLLTVRNESGEIVTAGAALGTYDNITHAPDIISLLFVTNGIDLANIDKQQDFLKQALNYYTSFSTSSDSVWNNTLSPSRDMFISGKLAMYFGYSWDIFVIKEKNKDLKFEIHPVPYLPLGGSNPRKVTIASYWANGVSVKSKHQKEASLFLKYLAEKNTLQKTYTEASKIRSFGMPYSRIDLAVSLSDNPVVYPFVKQAAYATSSYFSSDTHDSLYNGPLNEYLGNAIRQVTSSSGSTDSAIDALLQGIKQVHTQIR